MYISQFLTMRSDLHFKSEFTIEFFTIGKSVRSDRNKKQLLRIIII